MTDKKPVTWIFDGRPPSGARRGGDPASHAFEHTLETLVREVIQNANDQALVGQDPEVVFRFVELVGPALAAFRAAVDWDELWPHLDAVARQNANQRFSERLDATKGRLLVLVIEDRQTVGLTGAEQGDNSHFAALCKDILLSFKTGEKAGGSYGLGKSVLWTFSGYGTVLFNSNLSEPKPPGDSPRFIGRVELPSHEIGGNGYSGPGWLGAPRRSDVGRWAESLWGEAARDLAKALGMARPTVSGTSIGIVDFHSPVDERNDDPASLVEEMKQSAARNFWPAAFASDRLRIGFERDGVRELLSLDEVAALRPFAECQMGFQEHTLESLVEPGDIVSRDIPITLPPRKDGKHERLRARVRLTVRLAEPDAASPYVSHIAMYRGAGMVVRYANQRTLAIGARPFHAVLAAGLARNPGAPDESDRHVEAFLRAAEPPGHDQWQSTTNLKNRYKQGYLKAIEGMERAALDALKDLVRDQPQQGVEGPDLLRRKFPLDHGKAVGGQKGASAFHFRQLRAHFDGKRWDFQGEIRPNTKGASWVAEVSLRELGEDGSVIGPVAIESATVESAGASCERSGETVIIRAPTGLDAVSFQGVSEPVTEDLEFVGALGLEVRGRVWKREPT